MTRLDLCSFFRRSCGRWTARPAAHAAVATVLGATLVWAIAARAGELYWDINGTTDGATNSPPNAAGTWNATNTYWNTDPTGGAGGTISAWVPGEVPVFSAGGNATGTFTITVSGTHQISGLRFEEGAVTLSGGALQFSGGATFTHNAAAGDCPINSAVQGNGELVLTGVNIWGRLNGVVSESGGTLSVRLASGNWVLGGQHTFTGGTTIDGGYAVATVSSTGPGGSPTSGPFGTGTFRLVSGLFRPTSGADVTIANPVSLDGNFTLGDSSSSKILTFTGPVTLTGTRTLTTNSSPIVFSGVLGESGGSFALTKSGTSALTLGASNTFSGGLTIDNGTVILGNAGALNSTTPNAVTFVSNTNTKTLRLNGNSVTVSGLINAGGSGAVVENNAAGTVTLTVDNASGNTFAGVLQNGAAGTLALTKNGAGTLTLSGSTSNTYTGLTTINSGTLSLAKSGGATAIAGDIVVNGGKLSFAAANQVADTSSITVNGSAQFTTENNADTVRNVTMNSSVTDPNLNRLSNLNITGTLTMTQGVAGLNSGVSMTAQAVTMSGGSRIEMAANTADTTFNIGSGGLTMSGATLRFGWVGLDSVQTALVNLGGDFTGSGTNNLDYNTALGPRLLDLGGATRTFNVTSGTTTISPTIQNGGLTKTGPGTLVLTGTVPNTYTGLTTVSAGTLHLNKTGVNAVGGDLSIAGGGKVTFGANHQIADTAAVTISGAGSVLNGTGPAAGQDNLQETIGSLNATGGVFNTGSASVWSVTGAASFTGGAGNTIFVGNSGSTLYAGSLSLTAMTATAGGTVGTPNSFTLYGNHASIRSSLLVGTGGLTLDGSVLNLRRGSAAGAKGSRLVLDGDVATAGTSSSRISEDTAGGTLGTIGVELSSTAGTVTRTFAIAGGGANLTVSVPITNGAATTAGITKAGLGTLTLSGANTYTGTTTIDAGTLVLNGTHTGGGLYTVAAGATLAGSGSTTAPVTVADGGILVPGNSPGTLSTGSLTLSEASILRFELDAPNLGNSPLSDRIDVAGNLVLDGLLVVEPLAGFGTPRTGDRWRLFNYTGSLTDNGLVLDAGLLPGLPPAMYYYIDTSVVGQVNLGVGVPEPGSLGLIALGLLGLLPLARRFRRS